MEDLNKDIITRHIITGSKLEISNPYFNDAIIQKIVQQKKRRAVISYIFSASLLIIAATVFVMLSIPSQLPVTAGISARFDLLDKNILIVAGIEGNQIIRSISFLLPVAILFMLKKLLDLKYRYLNQP